MKRSTRIGYILLCLVPLVGSMVLQFIISIPFTGLSAMVTFLTHYKDAPSPQEMLDFMLDGFTDSTFLIGVSAACAFCSLAVFGFWYWKRLKPAEERVSPAHAFNGWIFLALVLLAFGMQYLISYIISFLSILQPDWINSYENLIDSAGLNTVTPLIALYGCIIAPISEEIIFRGVTLGYAKKCMPVAAAICYQGILFGIFHMNIIQGIYASLFGFFLGYVREKGGSLLISMVLHSIFNICGLFFNDYLFYGNDQTFFFLLWLTVGVLMTYGGIFLFQHGVVRREAAAEKSA